MLNWENGMVQLTIAATLLTVIFVFFLIAALVGLKGKQSRKERQLLRALIDERERTMYMISTELHDNASQVLNLARMTMNMIAKHAVPEQTKYITEAGYMLDNVIAELRKVSHSLNDNFLRNRGLINIVSEEAKWINIAHDIQCNFEISGNPETFEPDTELMLIRIVQEATNNVLKHANAKNLLVHLSFQNSLFEMTIKDDGIGFDIDKANPWNGIGLQSISHRNKIIGGDIAIISSKENGTEIKLHINNPKYANSTPKLKVHNDAST